MFFNSLRTNLNEDTILYVIFLDNLYYGILFLAIAYGKCSRDSLNNVFVASFPLISKILKKLEHL